MATADSVKEKLQSLIAKANTVTGGSDATLSSAVDTLIAGYGQGSGTSPSGSISITENGTHDVTNYASAVVNVSVSETISVVRNITIDSTLGNGSNSIHTILTADSFVAEHYADDGFSAMLYLATPIAAETNVGHCVYVGNKNIGSSTVPRYGFFYYSTSESAIGVAGMTAKISETGYNITLRAKSTGNMDLYVASNRIMKAGEYILVLTCAS